MRNKRLNLFLGIVIFICTLVTIFVMFANAFADVNNLPDARGSVYKLMFKYESMGYNSMPLLICAFVWFVCAAVFCIAGAFIPGKIGAIINGLDVLLLAAGAIILFCCKQIFGAAGTVSGAPIYDWDEIKLGVGTILPAISALIGAVLSLYSAYTDFKGN